VEDSGWNPERTKEIGKMSKKELLAELDERGGLRVDPKWRKPMLVQKLLNAEMEADEDWDKIEEDVPPDATRSVAVGLCLKPPREVEGVKLKITDYALCTGGAKAMCAVSVAASAMLNGIPTVASVGSGVNNLVLVCVSTLLPFMLQPSDPDGTEWSAGERVVTTASSLQNFTDTSLLPPAFVEVLRRADEVYVAEDAALVASIRQARLALPGEDRPLAFAPDSE
jgi:hypothetical protein